MDLITSNPQFPFRTDNELSASKREQTIDKLYSELQKGYLSYLEGKVKSMEEVFSKYDA